MAYWKRYDCKQYRALLLRVKPQEQQDSLNTSQDSTTPAAPIETTSQRVYSSSPHVQRTIENEVIQESPRTPMLSTSVAAPGRVSQSASKNAIYIEQALQKEDYGKHSCGTLDIIQR